MIRGAASSIANALRNAGEALTLRQPGVGTYNAATGVYAPGANVDTSVYGQVNLIRHGVDGISVIRGDLEVWIPKAPLDAAGVSVNPGAVLIRANGDTLRVLESEAISTGVYRVRARAPVAAAEVA